MRDRGIRIYGLEGIPEIQPGDDLCAIILEALGQRQGDSPDGVERRLLEDGLIFVVAQKVVSKAEGRLIALEDVIPSARAEQWAAEFQKDPRMIEVVLRETRRIVRMDRGVLIAETHHGFICAHAGVDASNAPMGTVVLLPEDPDRSAANLRHCLEHALKSQVGVVISDTFGRPWRQGLTNVALGVAGFSPFVDYRGTTDCFGRTLHATLLAVADELAAAAEIVMGKTLNIPVAIIEGFRFHPAEGSGRELIRPPAEDLFR